MGDLYKMFAEVYDDCGIDDFSLTFGEVMLEYFDRMHPDKTFRKNLDICCGTGTLCNFFKDNGIETKGVDISREMLDIACKKYPDIEFEECDVVEYHDDETYDFVTCVSDALNNFIDTEDIKRIFGNVNKLLRVNGLFIFDIANFDIFPFEEYNKALDDFRRLSYHIHRNGKIITIDTKYYEDDVLLWESIDDGRDFSIEEITQFLNEEGFVVESISQHFFNEKRSEKWKIVAKKV